MLSDNAKVVETVEVNWNFGLCLFGVELNFLLFSKGAYYLIRFRSTSEGSVKNFALGFNFTAIYSGR